MLQGDCRVEHEDRSALGAWLRKRNLRKAVACGERELATSAAQPDQGRFLVSEALNHPLA
jgi:hypothetical protein